MSSRPTGTVTFLFTDIEGSTRLWEQDPQAMQAALARHDALLRQAIQAHGGYIVKMTGDGIHAAFAGPAEALAAAVAAQQVLLQRDASGLPMHAWGNQALSSSPLFIHPSSIALRLRMALHTGMAEERDGDYFGPEVNRAARLMTVGSGGQILLSQATYDRTRDHLPPDVHLRDLGEHRLKDLARPEHIYQVVAPGLPADFPPLKTLNHRLNHLPAQRDALIGRETEVAALCQLLRRPNVGLVTLTGPGGTGKTRLALSVAADLLDEFPDGVYFVNLAPIIEPSLVASTIAQALDVREQGGKRIEDALRDAVRDKRLLLVLDNFEQITAAASIVAGLLAAAPNLKALVTSRAVLRLRGEHEFPVPPLALPPRTEDGLRNTQYEIRNTDYALRITQYSAVALFVERASVVKPDFAVTHDTALAIAAICHRLDGLPLAIELAATRIRLLSPQAILTRLENRMKLLTGGARDLPPRQQTLRSALEWSYDLLSPAEQRLFRRLAVFSGGRALEAIEAVCNAGGDLGIEALDGVDALVSQSLIKQVVGDGGELRFVMLETIHEYARERLDASGEADLIRERHLDFCLGLAEEAERHVWRATQATWFRRLEIEHDNLRAALDWSLAARPDKALRLASALGLFWLAHGHHTEGLRWLAHALERDAGQMGGEVARAHAYRATALLAEAQADHKTSQTAAQTSVAIYRQMGDARGLAYALAILGFTVATQGEAARGRSLIEESIELFRRQADQPGLARALSWHGHVAYLQRHYAQAQASCEESLALAQQAGLPSIWGYAALTLGRAAVDQGDLPSARSFYEQSLALYRQIQDKYNTQVVLAPLGIVAAKQGDFEQARAFLSESLTLRLEAGSRRNIAGGLDAFAYLAAAQGQAERAARLLGAADGLYASAGGPRVNILLIEYERHLPAIRDQLGATAFAAAQAEGRAMSLEQAVAYALEQRLAREG